MSPKGIASSTIIGWDSELNKSAITKNIATIPPINATSNDFTDSLDFSASPP